MQDNTNIQPQNIDNNQNDNLEGEPLVPEKFIEGTDKNWQSKYDKAVKENERLKMELEHTQNTMLQKATTNQNEDVLPELPPKPYNYNMVDALTDQSSDSARYYKAEQEYNQKLLLYNNKRIDTLTKELQTAKQEKIQQQMAANIKAQTISAMIKAGLNEEEAIQRYDWFNNVLRMPIEQAAKEIAKVTKKTAEVSDRQNPKEFIPGVNVGNMELASDEGKQFFEGMKTKIHGKKYFVTK